MQNETNTRAAIIALLDGRTQVSLENIRQFILDLDERDYMEFLYPVDPDFAEEFSDRDADAKAILETVRHIEGTLRDLDRGRISNSAQVPQLVMTGHLNSRGVKDKLH